MKDSKVYGFELSLFLKRKNNIFNVKMFSRVNMVKHENILYPKNLFYNCFPLLNNKKQTT